MSGKFFSSSINALIRTCRCCGDVTGVIAGEVGDVTGVIAGEVGGFTGVVVGEVTAGMQWIVAVSFALAAMVQPSKGGDVIEVLADEGVVTRVVASEDGRFAGVVAGEARGCSVAAMVQPAVAARCSRWAMSIYCCRVETNGYI